MNIYGGYILAHKRHWLFWQRTEIKPVIFCSYKPTPAFDYAATIARSTWPYTSGWYGHTAQIEPATDESINVLQQMWLAQLMEHNGGISAWESTYDKWQQGFARQKAGNDV